MAVKRNMSPNKCPMPVQDPEVRRNNFEEVALGYTYEMAVEEAKRCLNCPKKPCRSACPVAIDIPAFIERVANEDMEGAFEILSASSALPAVCGTTQKEVVNYTVAIEQPMLVQVLGFDAEGTLVQSVYYTADQTSASFILEKDTWFTEDVKDVQIRFAAISEDGLAEWTQPQTLTITGISK